MRKVRFMESRLRNARNGLAIFGVTSTFLLACTTITPHENFKAHLNAALGSTVDSDPMLSMCSLEREYPVESKSLPNGNVEAKLLFFNYIFFHRKVICTYFCEYDPVARKVVRVRFEGKEESCSMPP